MIAACNSNNAFLSPLSGQNTPPFTNAGTVMDPVFSEPYIDIDVWRSTPVKHRYIHGGFKGTDTRFSYYFPPASQYQGRFFQHVTPIPDSENLATNIPPGEYNKIGFAADSGAYFVETNGGGQLDLTAQNSSATDSTIGAYRANAAAAAYSRVVAQAIYRTDHRPYGYLYGGSGGGYRTIGAMENTENVWDGAVPYVIGSTMAIPNMFSVRMHAMRVLRKKFPQIVAALEPGGSGNPYEGLSDSESAALREVTKMGFPPESWFGYKDMGIHGFAALYNGIKMADPSYFDDFWTKPGYLGHDDPHSFDGDRVQFSTTVSRAISRGEASKLGLASVAPEAEKRGGVDNAFKNKDEENDIIGFLLDDAPPEVYFLGGDLHIHSGSAAGHRLTLSEIEGRAVILGIADASIAQQIQPGDEITVDNSDFLASQTYHRHQVPEQGFPVWDQFRDESGQPIYPQRPMILGPLFVEATSGSKMTGKYDGKMIVVASLWDREAMPWQADWYRQQVAKHSGANTVDKFRLYYTEHALHGDEPELEDPSRVVSYQGMLQQALRDLAAWVEDGVAPPESTKYEVIDGQIIVPQQARQRMGLQPVVHLSINGGKKIELEAGDTVTFEGTVSVPPGAGTIVRIEWDFLGNGNYQTDTAISMGQSNVSFKKSRTFEHPGSYFVSVRATSKRSAESKAPYSLISNLDRAKVIVKE